MRFRRFICRKQAERVVITTVLPTEETDREKQGQVGPAVTSTSRSTESQRNTLVTEQLNRNPSQSLGEKTTSLVQGTMSAHNETTDGKSCKSLDCARHGDPIPRAEISFLSFDRQSEALSYVNKPSCEPTDNDIDTPKRKGSGGLWYEQFYRHDSSLFSLLRQSETSSDGETPSFDLGSEGSTQFAVIGREADTTSSEENSNDDVDDFYDSEEWQLFLGSCGGAALLSKAHSENAMS